MIVLLLSLHACFPHAQLLESRMVHLTAGQLLDHLDPALMAEFLL